MRQIVRNLGQILKNHGSCDERSKLRRVGQNDLVGRRSAILEFDQSARIYDFLTLRR
jgi:hypothetical protein